MYFTYAISIFLVSSFVSSDVNRFFQSLWYILVPELSWVHRLWVASDSPLGLRPKTQERYTDWSSWLRQFMPGPVGYGHGVRAIWQAWTYPVVLCVDVSREEGACRVPKMSLVLHTKNFVIFTSERLWVSGPASDLKWWSCKNSVCII